MDDNTLKKHIESLCNKHDICLTLGIFLVHHNRGKFNGYHNNVHLYDVACRCDEALHTDEFKHLLGTDDAKALIISALLHDAHHSGGFDSDIINVSRAINAALKHMRSVSCSHRIIEMVSENIWCTVFHNGKFPHEPVNDCQKILRDADLMQLFRQHGKQVLFGTGLIGELRRSGVISNDTAWITIDEFLIQNDVFINLQKMYTNWGNEQRNIHNSLAP